MTDATQQIYEQTLVLRSQLGDTAAFAELLARFAPRLAAYLHQMLRNSPELVEDIAQDTWVAIYRGLPGLLEVSKFKPWAFRIARDRLYREFRRRKLPVQPLEVMDVEAVAAEPDHTAFDFEALHHGLDRLTPEHREALVLHFLEELSYEDIARITGAALGTVRSRIHYGKRALRSALERNT